MFSVGDTYLYKNVTQTSCLDAIFTCSIYDVAVTCFFGGILDLTKSKHGNYVLLRYGLNSTKAQEVSLCTILFILLVGLSHDLMF